MATPHTAMSRSELLGALMKEHRDALTSYAERSLGDRALAEDIVQEAMIRAWRNIDHLGGMGRAVRGWLFTVTRHLIIDWVRKPHVRREVIAVGHHEPVSTTDDIEAVRHAMVVATLLARLSPEHRAVLVHLYLCDRTTREAAGILGVPPGTVKSRHHHALRGLRAVARLEAA
ncbi:MULTISPECIES: sigma-70 family RNA polymerase sigma factor [unclassified Streptomyces]|uniref:sigma-70 family RNA polymerase sigma factor n=1 Tax=unclassified Streptomyces TaxID=2593676 RepID=UPI001F01AF8B|nr:MULTISPECIES: sigma-70 family RNA polymerase sigma factor [unclassified Streptomyces]